MADTEKLRYEGRMKPFRSIGCPEVVDFDYFRSVVDNEDVEVLTHSCIMGLY